MESSICKNIIQNDNVYSSKKKLEQIIKEFPILYKGVNFITYLESLQYWAKNICPFLQYNF